MKLYLIYPISENILHSIKIGNSILHANELSVNPLPTDFVYSVDIHEDQLRMNSDGTYQLHLPYRVETYPVKVYKNGLGQIIRATETASYRGVMFNSPRKQPELQSISYEGIVKELKIILDYISENSKIQHTYATGLVNVANELKRILDDDKRNPLDVESPELHALRSEATKIAIENLKAAANAENKSNFLLHLKTLASKFQLISKIVLVTNEIETEHSHADPRNPLKNTDIASMIRAFEREWRMVSDSYSGVLSDPKFREIYESLDSLIKENLIQLKLRKGILDIPHQTPNSRRS